MRRGDVNVRLVLAIANFCAFFHLYGQPVKGPVYGFSARYWHWGPLPQFEIRAYRHLASAAGSDQSSGIPRGVDMI